MKNRDLKIMLIAFIAVIALALTIENCGAQTKLVRYHTGLDSVREAKAATITFRLDVLFTEYGQFTILDQDQFFKMDSTETRGRFIVSRSLAIDPEGDYCLITRIYFEKPWLDQVVIVGGRRKRIWEIEDGYQEFRL